MAIPLLGRLLNPALIGAKHLLRKMLYPIF